MNYSGAGQAIAVLFKHVADDHGGQVWACDCEVEVSSTVLALEPLTETELASLANGHVIDTIKLVRARFPDCSLMFAKRCVDAERDKQAALRGRVR